MNPNNHIISCKISYMISHIIDKPNQDRLIYNILS